MVVPNIRTTIRSTNNKPTLATTSANRLQGSSTLWNSTSHPLPSWGKYDKGQHSWQQFCWEQHFPSDLRKPVLKIWCKLVFNQIKFCFLTNILDLVYTDIYLLLYLPTYLSPSLCLCFSFYFSICLPVSISLSLFLSASVIFVYPLPQASTTYPWHTAMNRHPNSDTNLYTVVY